MNDPQRNAGGLGALDRSRPRCPPAIRGIENDSEALFGQGQPQVE